MKFGIYSQCTAFNATGIGSRVLNVPGFYALLERALKDHDTTQDDAPGQHYVRLPDAAPIVSAGVGVRTPYPDDYVLRTHRGEVGAYLKREHALITEQVACVVYTRDAYLADPEVTQGEESYLLAIRATHVIVAVLASAGPESPLTPARFVSNLAGGNKAALNMDADDIRADAAIIADYWRRFAVVAD